MSPRASRRNDGKKDAYFFLSEFDPMSRLDGFNLIEKALIIGYWVLDKVLSIMLLTIFALLFAQVLFRYVFSMPIYWIEESVLYLMAYTTMIGCASAYRRYLHPQLVIVYDRFKLPALFWYELLLRVPVMALMFVFTWHGYRYALANEWMKTSGLEISFFWPFFAVPLGGGITLLALLLDSLDIILHRRSWLMNKNVPEYNDDN